MTYIFHSIMMLFLFLCASPVFLTAQIATAPATAPGQANVLLNAQPVTSTLTKEAQSNSSKKKKKKKHKKGNNEDEATIWLNFENASLARILDYLAEQKNINVFPHEDLSNINVSLTTRHPLTLKRAWNVLLTLLEMNGYSIVKVDKLYRVISNKENQQHPLPTFSSQTGTQPEDLPDSDLMVRYVYFFNNMRADMAQGILSTMLEGDNAIQINPDLQLCILKEKSFNIKAAMKIIKELDTGGLRESIKIIQLQEAKAEEVQALFTELLGETQERTLRFVTPGRQQEAAYFSSATKIIAEPLKNQLILLGTEKNLNRISHFIAKNIDVPLETSKSRLHIKELRHAKAEVLGPLLANIIKPPAGQATTSKYKFFEDVVIVAEEASTEEGRGSGNRLVIACNLDDWKRLEKFIDKLDKPTPQVAVEIIIVDITDNNIRSLGVQLKNKLGKRPGLGINTAEFRNLHPGTTTNSDQTTSNLSSFIDIINSLNGAKDSPTFVTLGKTQGIDSEGATTGTENVWALIKAVFSVTNTNILSQPYLVINNFETANFTFSERRLVDGPLDSEKVVNAIANKIPKDAATKIDITPQINSDGIIDLKIVLTNNEFSTANPELEGTTERGLTTKASMASGEVLVLGGLKKSNLATNVYKTPLFADIPLIGNLFKNKNKSKIENNLYVFIRPSIIKPKFEGAPDEYTQLKLDYAKLQMFRNDFYAKDPDPIQRWFFKPTHQSVQRSIQDAKIGRFRPIDNFNYGKWQPKTVNIANDPYYKVSEALEQTQKKLKKRKKRKKKQETEQVTANA